MLYVLVRVLYRPMMMLWGVIEDGGMGTPAAPNPSPNPNPNPNPNRMGGWAPCNTMNAVHVAAAQTMKTTLKGLRS